MKIKSYYLLVLIFIFSSTNAFAQGTFLFSNLADGVDAPITFDQYGVPTPVLGPEYIARAIIYDDFAWSYVATEPFSEDPTTAGYFLGPVVEISGTSPGSVVTMFVEVSSWPGNGSGIRSHLK